MPNDELTRSQYIAALLNQKKTYNASGGNLVNPSISGLAELDTSFAGVQPVANPKQQEKADVSEQSGFDKFMNNVLGFVDEIAAKFGAGFVGGWEGGLDLIATGIGALGDWTGWYNSKPFTDWAKQDIGSTAAEWSKTAFGLGAWYNRFRNWDWNADEWADIGKGFVDLNQAAFFQKNDLGNARDISDKHYKANDEVLGEMNIGEFKAGEFLGGIANSIGFMLPAIMTAGAAGAAGAGQTAVKATSLLTLGLGAAGQGSEEALNEGASAGKALGYGAASGAVEVASEIVVGPILAKMGLGTGNIAGVVGGKSTTSALSRGAKRELVKEIAKNAFEEGAEEVFSALFEPITKSIYQGTDAFKDSNGNFIYSSAEYWLGKDGNFNDSVLGQFASGAITGGIMSGAAETQLYKKAGSKGYLAIKSYANFTEALSEVKEAGKKYGTNSEQYKKAVEKASKEIVEFEELSKELDENKLNYVASLLNNPQALERALQKDAQEKTNANVKQFIQNVVKEGKNVSASVFRNTFNELQNKLGTDVELVLEEGAKNQYDSKNNTITLDTNILETEGGQKLVHEYLGHALSGAISNENQTALFNKIMQTETGKYLEKAFEEDEDYNKLKKGSSDYKEEMIANYIERAFETETKAKNFIQQLGSLNQLVGNKTLFERFLDLFKGTKSFKNNNAIFGEYTKLLNNFLKASSSLNKTSRIFTIAEKLKEGKKLTESEKKFYEKYKNAVDAAKEISPKQETTKYSKNLKFETDRKRQKSLERKGQLDNEQFAKVIKRLGKDYKFSPSQVKEFVQDNVGDRITRKWKEIRRSQTPQDEQRLKALVDVFEGKLSLLDTYKDYYGKDASVLETYILFLNSANAEQTIEFSENSDVNAIKKEYLAPELSAIIDDAKNVGISNVYFTSSQIKKKSSKDGITLGLHNTSTGEIAVRLYRGNNELGDFLGTYRHEFFHWAIRNYGEVVFKYINADEVIESLKKYARDSHRDYTYVEYAREDFKKYSNKWQWVKDYIEVIQDIYSSYKLYNVLQENLNEYIKEINRNREYNDETKVPEGTTDIFELDDALKTDGETGVSREVIQFVLDQYNNATLLEEYCCDKYATNDKRLSGIQEDLGVKYSKYIDNGVYEIDGKNFRVNRNYDGTYEVVEQTRSKDKIVKKFDNFEEAAAYINKYGKRITAKVGRYQLGDGSGVVEVSRVSKGKYEVIVHKAETMQKVKRYNEKGEAITKNNLAQYGKKLNEATIGGETVATKTKLKSYIVQTEDETKSFNSKLEAEEYAKDYKDAKIIEKKREITNYSRKGGKTIKLNNLKDIQLYLQDVGAKYIENEQEEFGANRTGEVKSFDTEEEMLKYLESEGVKVEGKIKNIYDSNSYRYFINKDAKTGKLNVKKVFEHEIKPIEVEASDSELEAADHKELAGIDTKKTIYVNKGGKVFWIKIKGVYNVEYKVKNSDKTQITKNATEDQVQKMQSDKSLDVLNVTRVKGANEVQTKGESKVMSDKEVESYLYNQSTNFSNNRADVATQKLYPTTYVLTDDGKTFFQIKVRETRKGFYEVMRDNNSPMWTTEKNVTYKKIMDEVNSYKYHSTNGDVEGLKKHIQFLKKMEKAEARKQNKQNKQTKQELEEQKAKEKENKPKKSSENGKSAENMQNREKKSHEKKSKTKTEEKPKEEKLNRKVSAKTKEGEEIKVSRTTEEKVKNKNENLKQPKVVEDQDVEVLSSEKIDFEKVEVKPEDFVRIDNRTAEQIKAEAKAYNDKYFNKEDVIDTMREISSEILKIAKVLDGENARVAYNDQSMSEVAERIFKLVNTKNVTADKIIPELEDIFKDVRIVVNNGKFSTETALSEYVDTKLMDNPEVQKVVRDNIEALLKGGKLTKAKILKDMLKKVTAAMQTKMKQIKYSGERLAVFNNQRARIKRILRRYAKVTNMDVSKVGFNALLEPFAKLHRRGLAYNATDFVESLEKVLDQYNAAKWQEDYPDLRYNPEIRANLEMLLEETRSGKLAGGELMQKCTDTIKMIFEEIRKAEMDYTEKVLPSVNQTISVLKQNRYGQNKNVIAGLFRSYKRGFAPAYVVLEQVLGGNSTLARKLTYEYQTELNKKQLYTGAYHDEINKKLKEFGLKKTFDSKTFDIDGHTLTADQAMNLYISLNTQANYDAINEDGAVYKDSKTRVNKEIAKKGEAEQLKQKINNILPDEYKKLADWLLATMNSSVKKEYVGWYEKAFGKFQMRNEIGEIGQNTYWTLNRAYNFMTNGEKGGKNPSAYFQNSKSRTKGGDNEVMIGGAISTFDGYIDGLGAEMFTKPVYREALRLLNTKNADGVSVMDVLSKTVDSKDVQYIRDTMADMVGKLNNERNLLDKFVGSFSIAKLSLNVGSMLKQFASAFTSNIPIRKTTRALLAKMFQDQNYKSEYRELVDEIGGLKYREKNKGIVEANADSMFGIAEKVARVGMIGISKVDLFTVSTGVYSLMAIGQDQFGYKIGTEENKKFVKEHWTEYELSQIGNTPLSKNAITRGDSLVRYIFGFLQGANRAALGSQLHKFGLWERNHKVDGEKLKADRDVAKAKFEKAEAEYKAEFERVNNSEVEVDETTLEDLREKYIDAKTEYEDLENRVKDYDSYLIAGGKNIPVNMAAGILAQGVLIALVNALMKRIKGKKDWDEIDVAEEGMALAMAIGVDWIPFVNTISNIVQGYEVTVPAVELFNQFSFIFKNAKSGNTNSTIRQIAILLGDLTGIPVQTIYQYIYGAVKTFDPEIAYEMNSVLYGSSLQSATKTLKNYADKGKTKKTETMVGIIMKNYKTGSTTDAINKEMARLYTSGYSVLPTTALTQYKNENGETVKLTNEQINQFKQLYNGATKEASNLLNLTDYKYASDENKAKAIKKLYDAYYQYAKYKVVGNETSNKLVKILALTNGNVNLAKYIVSMQKITEITDTARKTRKELVIQYVNRLRNMNSQEKALLLYLSGFSVAGNSKVRLKNYLVSKGASRKDVIALLGK